LTIFLSAVLLFQMQLIIAKYLLPWFGGTPALWTTCMLFFQITLTGGYAYSHAIISRLSNRRQSRIHLFLLGSSIVLILWQVIAWHLPLLPPAAWKYTVANVETIGVLGLLAVSAGVPFFVLATTSSLLGAWFARSFPNRSPYVLYAVSNAGSLLGLLSYPFLVEPNFGLALQSRMWTGGYVLFVACCGYIALRSGRQGSATSLGPDKLDAAPARSTEGEKPTVGNYVLWLILAACASTVFLATTNKISVDVAVIPFLWVLPLSIYLLTFILCFSFHRLYHRGLFVIGALVAMLLVCRMMLGMSMMGTHPYLTERVVVYYLALFICCMLCHGELVRGKPPSRYLTQFYLTISVGGALGGIFVGIVAPYFFDGLWELYFGYFFSGCAVMAAVCRDRNSLLNLPKWRSLFRVSAATVVVLVGVAPFFLMGDRLPQKYRSAAVFVADKLGLSRYLEIWRPDYNVIEMRRNFYGTLRVVKADLNDQGAYVHMLFNGETLHGVQYRHDDHHRRVPTLYYGPDSGVALAIMNHPRYRTKGVLRSQMRVGIAGLGAGTVARYGRGGDYYRIYEINPAIVELAAYSDSHFSFVADSKADVDIVVGDARISMEREEPQSFDILVLDAFSGDAIPTHLLTREAFDTYLRHIRTGGIIAVHISNRYLDFQPIMWKLADEMGLWTVTIRSHSRDSLSYDTDWILLTKDEDLLLNRNIANASSPRIAGKDLDYVRTWTDDYSDLFQLLH